MKDIHEKIKINPLDSKFIQDSLKEILRGAEQFTNLQKVAQNFELSDEIDEIGTVKVSNIKKSMSRNVNNYTILGVELWNSSIALKKISDSRGTGELIALSEIFH